MGLHAPFPSSPHPHGPPPCSRHTPSPPIYCSPGNSGATGVALDAGSFFIEETQIWAACLATLSVNCGGGTGASHGEGLGRAWSWAGSDGLGAGLGENKTGCTPSVLGARQWAAGGLCPPH